MSLQKPVSPSGISLRTQDQEETCSFQLPNGKNHSQNIIFKKKQQHIVPSRFDISQSDTGKFVSSREMAVPSGKCRPVNEMFRCQTGNPWKLRVYLANYFRRSKWKPLVLIQSPRYRSNAGLHHFDIKESVHKLCVWHLIEIPGSWSHRIFRNILPISKSRAGDQNEHTRPVK